jgi:hypothetical protein
VKNEKRGEAIILPNPLFNISRTAFFASFACLVFKNSASVYIRVYRFIVKKADNQPRCSILSCARMAIIENAVLDLQRRNLMISA